MKIEKNDVLPKITFEEVGGGVAMKLRPM